MSPVLPSQRFESQRIVLGVCGGIAAYKVCDLIRELYRQGAQTVTALMTPSASAFITPLTLESLTRRPVYQDNAGVMPEDGTPVHIAMAQQHDVMMIVPATANMLAKLAYGMADDIVSTTALTFTGKPIVVAPAMNGRMWTNPAVLRNRATLEAQENMTLVTPQSGVMACGEEGEGKLAPESHLLLSLYQALHPLAGGLQGKRVVITAGGTQEPLDDVRTITNRSSGKMGIALADECYAMGADVTLIHTLGDALPTKPYTTLAATTVVSMADLTIGAFQAADMLVMAAAVSDFTLSKDVVGKVDKRAGSWDLHLVPTMDILKACSAMKQSHQAVIGFAAEHPLSPEDQGGRPRAMRKLKEKYLDLMVLNDVSRSDIGFAADDNEVTLLHPDGHVVHVSKRPKFLVAREIARAMTALNATTVATKVTQNDAWDDPLTWQLMS